MPQNATIEVGTFIEKGSSDMPLLYIVVGYMHPIATTPIFFLNPVTTSCYFLENLIPPPEVVGVSLEFGLSTFEMLYTHLFSD